MRIGLIGAGIAGLTAARGLRDLGHTCVLYDKGRGPGGRLSTRRAPTPLGEMQFDHGAQYITAKSNDFQTVLEDWEQAGAIAPWSARFTTYKDGQAEPVDPGHTRYVGVPGMNGVVKHLAKGLEVHWGVRLSGACRQAVGDKTNAVWTLSFEDGFEAEPVDALVLAVPVEQADILLEDLAPGFLAGEVRPQSDPCWTVMAGFDAPVLTGWDAARIEARSLAWAARNTSKPQRGAAEAWVLQASAAWSRDHLEAEKETIARALIDDFRNLTGAPEPIHLAAHRWRYSQTGPSGLAPAIYDRDHALGVCGDWRVKGKVEGAYKSGVALAKAIGAA